VVSPIEIFIIHQQGVVYPLLLCNWWPYFNLDDNVSIGIGAEIKRRHGYNITWQAYWLRHFA
jgi:hypothetical protein